MKINYKYVFILIENLLSEISLLVNIKMYRELKSAIANIAV